MGRLMLASIATCLALASVTARAQHAGDVLLHPVDGKLIVNAPYYAADIREYDVLGDANVFRTDDPGYNTSYFGALHQGDEIYFDVLSPLFAWRDGSWSVAPDEVYLRYTHAAGAAAGSVLVDGQSGEQPGFRIDRANILGIIHAHHVFELGAATGQTLPVGAYTFGQRISSPQYASSESFFIAFNNGLDESQFSLAYDQLINQAPGDTNGDGAVDLLDLNNVRNNFGQAATSPLGDTFPWDGKVDLGDLNAVRNHFGAAAPSRIVPEPTTLCVLLTMIATGVVWRSREPFCFVRPRLKRSSDDWAARENPSDD